jgi:dipeptidyl-peptidase-4
MYLVTTNVGAPKLEQWKYPLPGDPIITIQRVVIETETPRVIRLQMPPDPRRSSLCDDISCDGSFTDVEWTPDSMRLAFVSTSRDHKQANLRIADAMTGEVKNIYEERVATQYESGQGGVNWRYLPATNEFIWYSEKDGWGHLYLFDANTGRLKNQITKGDYVVTQIAKVDDRTRTIYFNANGREAGRDPYFSHFYSIGFDGKNLKLLTPEDANHQVSMTEDGKYLIDTFSKPDMPPTVVLRDMTGKQIAVVEKSDVSRLSSAGWKAPTSITVKSRDAKWDLYGLMFTPTNLDASKKYPIVNYIYPGPQGGGVGSRGSTRHARIIRRSPNSVSSSSSLTERATRSLESVSRRVLRQYGGQHSGRSNLRNSSARAEISVYRFESRRRLGTFGRRLCDGGGDVSLPGFL